MKAEMAAKDYKGQHLCENCWNGVHYTRDDRGRKLSNCTITDKATGKKCECHCREVLRTHHASPKVDRSGQTLIDTGDDVIVIGNPESQHRDNG